MVGPLVSYAVMMWIGISKYSVLGVKDTLDFPRHSCPSNLNLTTFVTSGVHNYSVNHGNQSLMVTGLSVAMTTAIPQVTQDRSVCIFNVLVVDEESWAFDIFIHLLNFWMLSSCHYIAPRLFKLNTSCLLFLFYTWQICSPWALLPFLPVVLHPGAHHCCGGGITSHSCYR